MTEKHNLTKEEFDKLFDLDVSVRAKKEVEAKLAGRFDYIIHKMADIIGRTVHWYDYDNEGGEYSPGYFDSDSYDTNIGYVGEFGSTKNEGFDTYQDSFPTTWLYEDFEAKLAQEVKEFNVEEQKAQEQKNKDKEKGKEIKAGILAKLTPEERCYIVFAKPEQVQEAQRSLKKQEDKLKKEQRKQLYKKA
jgi:hypothetical protein